MLLLCSNTTYSWLVATAESELQHWHFSITVPPSNSQMFVKAGCLYIPVATRLKTPGFINDVAQYLCPYNAEWYDIQSTDKYTGYFLDFCTIRPLFETRGVASFWTLEEIQVLGNSTPASLFSHTTKVCILYTVCDLKARHRQCTRRQKGASPTDGADVK